MVAALELRSRLSRTAALLGTILVIGSVGLGGCTSQSPTVGEAALRHPPPELDRGRTEGSATAYPQIVDCQLPARIHRLGIELVYLGPQRLIRTTARDCALRGGDLIASDPVNRAT